MRFGGEVRLIDIIKRNIELYGYNTVTLSPYDYETAKDDFEEDGVVSNDGDGWFVVEVKALRFSVHLDLSEPDYG